MKIAELSSFHAHDLYPSGDHLLIFHASIPKCFVFFERGSMSIVSTGLVVSPLLCSMSLPFEDGDVDVGPNSWPIKMPVVSFW